MASDVSFEKRNRLDLKTNRKIDEVAVIRNGREIAVLLDVQQTGSGHGPFP